MSDHLDLAEVEMDLTSDLLNEPRQVLKPRILHWAGIILILETGLIHYLAASSEFQEAPYMGYLFVANFLCALLAAYGIYRKQLWGWLFGLGVAGVSIAGYVWSRTNGMPGMAVEEWFTPYGMVALTVEGLFLVLVALRPWRISAGLNWQSPDSIRMKHFWPLSGMVALALISFPALGWDAYVASQIGQHEHVGDLAQVCSTPATSADELRQRYGVEVSLVVPTAMDSFVDVRLRVLDPDKAHNLLVNQAAILVGQQELVLAPHLHKHNNVKAGKLFLMFFPNRDKSVHSGSQVSLVFGRLRTEPFLVP